MPRPPPAPALIFLRSPLAAEEAAQEWARAAALRVIQRARELRQRLKEGALAGSCNASRGGRADPHAESRAAEKGGRGGVGEDQKESGKGDLGEVEEMAKEEAEKAAGGKRKRSKGKKERKKGDGVERNSHKERRGRVESMAVAERDKQRALTYAVNAILTVRENAAAAQFQLLVQQWREQGLRPGEVPDSTGEGVKEHAVPEGLQHSV